MYRFSAPVFLPLPQGWDLMAGEACLGIAIHCMPGAPGYSLGMFPLPHHDSSPPLPSLSRRLGSPQPCPQALSGPPFSAIRRAGFLLTLVNTCSTIAFTAL